MGIDAQEKKHRRIRIKFDNYYRNGKTLNRQCIGRLPSFEKETDQFVSWGGLKYITEEIYGHHHYYDLGYRLIRKYWGKGYTTEASKAVVDYTPS